MSSDLGLITNTITYHSDIKATGLHTSHDVVADATEVLRQALAALITSDVPKLHTNRGAVVETLVQVAALLGPPQDQIRQQFSQLSATKATELLSSVAREHYVPKAATGLGDTALSGWQKELQTLLSAPPVQRRVI